MLDPRIKEVYDALMDETTVDNAAKVEQVAPALESTVIREDRWSSRPPHERPTRDDVLARVVDYASAKRRAGSHGKRRILWNAFFRSFDLEFYEEGMSTHLWRLAEQVEYPECQLLARMGVRDGKKTSLEPPASRTPCPARAC